MREWPVRRGPCLSLGALLLLSMPGPARAQEEEASGASLRPVEAFAALGNRRERSRALFQEAAKVLLHPRCVNCHPSGERPLQGIEGRPHEPGVTRGGGGLGPPAMRCFSCHPSENAELARVPGTPHWRLAPSEMAWQGLTLLRLCEQLKDRERNGGRSLAEVVDHLEHDEVVAWGWHPGEGREPVPGTQAGLVALMRAWVKTGAACPEDDGEEERAP